MITTRPVLAVALAGLSLAALGLPAAYAAPTPAATATPAATRTPSAPATTATRTPSATATTTPAATTPAATGKPAATPAVTATPDATTKPSATTTPTVSTPTGTRTPTGTPTPNGPMRAAVTVQAPQSLDASVVVRITGGRPHAQSSVTISGPVSVDRMVTLDAEGAAILRVLPPVSGWVPGHYRYVVGVQFYDDGHWGAREFHGTLTIAEPPTSNVRQVVDTPTCLTQAATVRLVGARAGTTAEVTLGRQGTDQATVTRVTIDARGNAHVTFPPLGGKWDPKADYIVWTEGDPWLAKSPFTVPNVACGTGATSSAPKQDQGGAVAIDWPPWPTPLRTRSTPPTSSSPGPSSG